MRVVVTGATGFLGRHVIRALDRLEIDYIAIGRSYEKTNQSHRNMCILDELAVEKFFHEAHATHLIHLAWCTEHSTYKSSPMNFVWRQASLHLIDEFCRNGGGYALITGTCAEYSPKETYCSEDQSRLDPKTLYGAAKNDTRRLTETVCKSFGTKLTWARIFYPYGSGDKPFRLIPALVDVFRGNRAPFGVSSEHKRDFIHVIDVASAILACVNYRFHGPINICSGEVVTIRDVVIQIASCFGQKPYAVLDIEPVKNTEPLIVAGDNCQLVELGWRPTISLSTGLQDYITGGKIVGY